MLSLSPRYDLFRFALPKDFLPKEVEEKYRILINKNQAVITTPIDYLNESIQGINFPGISDILVQQQQHSSNEIARKLGKINVEPKTDITYQTSSNPLDKITKEFKITFRYNQGLYNYFMMYKKKSNLSFQMDCLQICLKKERRQRMIRSFANSILLP